MKNILRSCAAQGLLVMVGALCPCGRMPYAQEQASPRNIIGTQPQLVIFDTDIGDDIDDALALGLLLRSPELKVIGITAAWTEPALRARMIDRLLREAGAENIPVLQGPSLTHHRGAVFSQKAWALRGPQRPHADAIDFVLQQARSHPGEITLLSVAPMSNLGAAVDRDPESFRKLGRIVMMGGSVRRGYRDFDYTEPHHVDAEYNIAMDPVAAGKVFRSGVPIYMMPLDSTQIRLGEAERQILITHSSPLTDALALLYLQWSAVTKQQTPTMYDAVAVAFAVLPSLCPVTPMRIEVDQLGFTREISGQPNAQVCLHSDTEAFFNFFLPRILNDTQ